MIRISNYVYLEDLSPAKAVAYLYRRFNGYFRVLAIYDANVNQHVYFLKFDDVADLTEWKLKYYDLLFDR